MDKGATAHTTAGWRSRVEASLGDQGDFERDLVTRTLDGLRIEPLYGPESGLEPPEATEAATGAWHTAQIVGHPDPARANADLLEDLEGGATAATVHLDERSGVRAASLDELDRLFADVWIEAVPIAFTTSADGLPRAATFVALAKEQGLDPGKVSCHVGFDPFASFASLPGDLDDARREMQLLAGASRMHLDGSRSLAVDAGPWHRAGATAPQELGLAMAAFAEGLRWLEAGELPPSAAHSEYVFRFDVGADVFAEVAKLRAARVLHAKLLGAAGIERASAMVVHATAGSTRAFGVRDPWTNMLRTTFASAAAAMGGADLVTTVPFDQPLAPDGAARLPSPLGRRQARNTQMVLRAESRLDHVGDPTRGSYFVEQMTDALARAGWTEFQRIEAAGGLARALESGLVQDTVAESARERRRALEAGEVDLVGITKFPPPDDLPTPERVNGPDLAALEASRARRLEARGRMSIGAIDSFEHAVDAAARGATFEELGGALVRGAAPSFAPLLPFHSEPSHREVSA